MTQLRAARSKVFIKAVHSIAVCGWIGGGMAILVLLKLAGHPGGTEEVLAFQRCIKAIDDFLITPSAGLTAITGLLLCIGKRWGGSWRRWITEKCFVTTLLLVFGAFWLAPGLQHLVPADYWTWGFNHTYRRMWLWGATAAFLQTSILLLLVALSIMKPDKVKDRRGRN